ncbi:MAG: hypothetical protein JWN40_1584 [Phycisphaerales bacterium]|nr:hypothetical protein [Phycisphaerales bacterium]
MFVIRAKRQNPGDAGWVVMKTPLGLLCVAFAAEEDARAYLAATGASSHCEALSREVLLQRDPQSLDAVTHVLLIPCLEVARSLLRDPSGFPYDRYVVAMPHAV